MEPPPAPDGNLFRKYDNPNEASMVTIFQRECAETSEEDEQLAQALAQRPPGQYGQYGNLLLKDLSAASLPRINHFKCKWLKQARRTPKDKGQQQFAGITNEPVEIIESELQCRDMHTTEQP